MTMKKNLFILLCAISVSCIGCNYLRNNNQSTTIAENNTYTDSFLTQAAAEDHFSDSATQSEMAEMIKAAGLTDKQISEAERSGISQKEILTTWKEMEKQGISHSEINDMAELGYGFSHIIEVLGSLDGEEDKHFFGCLVLGSEETYTKAFSIDPNNLSGNMTGIMSEYAARLLEHEEEEAFITLNNALLGSTEPFYDIRPNGSRKKTRKTYCDIYLERMFTGTEARLQASTILLAAMEAEVQENGTIPDGYEELYQKHGLEMSMCAYWSTQSILIHRRGTHSYDDQFKIEQIFIRENPAGCIDYTMGYFSGSSKSRRSVYVGNGVISASRMDMYRRLYEAEK